jgi:peroxiredoxin
MTQGCTIEAHNFQRDLAKYDQANAVILGVSVDSVDSHKQFCAKDSLTFKPLADTDKKVVDSYGSLRPNGMAARNASIAPTASWKPPITKPTHLSAISFNYLRRLEVC